MLASDPPYFTDGVIGTLQGEVVRHGRRCVLSGESDAHMVVKQIHSGDGYCTFAQGRGRDTFQRRLKCRIQRCRTSKMEYPGRELVDYHHDHSGNAHFGH